MIKRYSAIPESFKSDYLEEIIHNERSFLRSAYFHLKENRASCLVDLKTDSDHWSIFSALSAAGKLAVAYNCFKQGKSKRELGELSIWKIEADLGTEIKEKEMVPLEVRFEKYIERNSKVVGEFKFDLGGGYFKGKARFKIGK
jgi:hypothetical protein